MVKRTNFRERDATSGSRQQPNPQTVLEQLTRLEMTEASRPERGQKQELADRLRAKGDKVELRAVDASDPSSVASLIADVESQFGSIEVLHYNHSADGRRFCPGTKPRVSLAQHRQSRHSRAGARSLREL
jgi:NAD(P)-dependent dehydrogenase (short-subunit alcohol dehydrogenase family)